MGLADRANYLRNYLKVKSNVWSCARALANDPKILLISDESTSALDPKTTKRNFVTLAEWTVNRFDHCPDYHWDADCQRNIANRVAVIQDGRRWKRVAFLKSSQVLAAIDPGLYLNGIHRWSYGSRLKTEIVEHLSENSIWLAPSMQALLQMNHFWMECTSTTK